MVDDSVHPYDFSKLGPLAYLPLNGSPLLEGVDLLPPLEDDIEQLAKEWYDTEVFSSSHIADINSFKEGYNKAREKYKYTEEDIIRLIEKIRATGLTAEYLILASQYPTEFECEMEIIGITDDGINTIEEIKTITTAKGVQWVGKYKCISYC